MPVIPFRDTRETKKLRQIKDANDGFRENVETLSESMLFISDHGVQNLTDHELADLTGLLIPLMDKVRRISMRLNGGS